MPAIGRLWPGADDDDGGDDDGGDDDGGDDDLNTMAKNF